MTAALTMTSKGQTDGALNKNSSGRVNTAKSPRLRGKLAKIDLDSLIPWFLRCISLSNSQGLGHQNPLACNLCMLGANRVERFLASPVSAFELHMSRARDNFGNIGGARHAAQ